MCQYKTTLGQSYWMRRCAVW